MGANMQELTVEAKIENMHEVFSFMAKELERQGCDRQFILQCKLCAEEIFMNISSYAYDPDTGPVRMEIEIRRDGTSTARAIMTFHDRGRPFNPLEQEKPDLRSDLDERPVGGLGIYIVTSVMDRVTYRYRDNENILTIEKEIRN